MEPNSKQNFSLFEKDESTFRAIFRSSNEGIIVADEGGVIQAANPISERMFGYTEGELTGKNVDTLVPVSLQQRHQAYRQIYTADPQPRSMGIGRDLNGKRKDGTEFAIEVSLSNTNLHDKMFVVAFIIDISRRKKAEEALKRSEEQLITYASELENRVKKRTEDLDRSIRQLEETNNKLQVEVRERERAEQELKELLARERDLNELKSRFVSMASHEFRTPLSSVLSSVNLIERYVEKGQPDKIEKHVGRIKGSVKNLTDILNDFLSLGKLEEGHVSKVEESISIRPYLEDLISEVEGILKIEQKIQTTYDVEDTLCSDPKILKNIFYNLISNASKYSLEGSLITIDVKGHEDKVSISVTDEGMGIPEEEQKHMFERFFRAKNATNIQGTGLGLNIVAKYVDLLEGEISFSSELDKGTTFTVSLPKK